MIQKIIVENYMSHTQTVIEPAAGLTVLLGPNNCGKSALVSALLTLCDNERSDFMVRHDAKEARVTVETSEGHVLVWQRRGTVVHYEINGQPVHRLQGKPPDNLHEFLKLPRVDAGDGDEPFDLHFGRQKSPLFLLNESERRAAVFFASASDAALLLEMQKKHRDKVTHRKSEAKELKSELARLERQLSTLAPLDELDLLLSQREADHAELLQQSRIATELAATLPILEHWQRETSRTRAETRALEPLPPPPVLGVAEPLENLVNQWRTTAGQVYRHQCRVEGLKPLLTPPSLGDDAALRALLGELERVLPARASAQGKCHALALLQPPRAAHHTEHLATLMQQLQQAERSRRVYSAVALCLRLPAAPIIHAVDPLRQLLFQMEQAQRKCKLYRAQKERAAPLTPMPTLNDTTMLAETVRAMAAARREHARAKALHTTLLVHPPPVCTEIVPLENLSRELSRQQHLVKRYRGVSEAAAQMSEPPLPLDPRPMADLLRRWEEARQSMHLCQSDCQRLDDDLSRLRAEWERQVRLHPLCPTCGAPLDALRLASGEHLHAN